MTIDIRMNSIENGNTMKYIHISAINTESTEPED